FSPLVVVRTPALPILLELGKGCLTRPTVRHYRGFARGRRKRLAEPDPTVKHLLYAYRVLLTGIHLMDSGELVSNLPTLNERFRLREIDDLIARKREGTEKMALDATDLNVHGALLDALEAQLDAAHGASHLPEVAPAAEAIDAFVVALRMAGEEQRGAACLR
ncbi:MAG: nucleotidyltransferase domain-containing protein, partial [Myxococcota bacterium]